MISNRMMVLICDVVNLVVGSWGLFIFMKISGMAIKRIFLLNIIESFEVSLTKYENITIIPQI